MAQGQGLNKVAPDRVETSTRVNWARPCGSVPQNIERHHAGCMIQIGGPGPWDVSATKWAVRRLPVFGLPTKTHRSSHDHHEPTLRQPSRKDCGWWTTSWPAWKPSQTNGAPQSVYLLPSLLVIYVLANVGDANGPEGTLPARDHVAWLCRRRPDGARLRRRGSRTHIVSTRLDGGLVVGQTAVVNKANELGHPPTPCRLGAGGPRRAHRRPGLPDGHHTDDRRGGGRYLLAVKNNQADLYAPTCSATSPI